MTKASSQEEYPRYYESEEEKWRGKEGEKWTCRHQDERRMIHAQVCKRHSGVVWISQKKENMVAMQVVREQRNHPEAR